MTNKSLTAGLTRVRNLGLLPGVASGASPRRGGAIEQHLKALGLKSLAIETADRLLRPYIRYSPVQAGRQGAWAVYERCIRWRTPGSSRIATTPFGFKVLIEQPTDTIQNSIWLTGRWEPVITEFFRRTLAPGDTFVDVGANIGYYSLLASRLVTQTGRVYAIEASPTILRLLQGNITLNRATNVEVIHAIAADREGEREFWLAPESNIGHSTSVEMLARTEGMRPEGRVRCGTLTSIVPADQLLNARLIKIDVEGGERAVLESILDRLPEFSSRTVWAVELSPSFCPGGQADVDWVFNEFCRRGYVAFSIKNGYSPGAYLSRPRSVDMEQIMTAPVRLTDVLFFSGNNMGSDGASGL